MKKLKILVTGGAGFIGSNNADAFIQEGHSVTIIDNLSSGNKKNINPKATFHKVDITDKRRVAEIFTKGRFDIVDHHAAQIDVRKSVEDPAFDARMNILGSLNLLDNCRRTGVKKFIFASSGGTIYGECGKKAPDESFPGNPLSPYGIAKFTVEFYMKFYAEIFGLKYTILRYANVYGPRQDPHGEAGVVAIFSQRMLKGEPIKIFGDGKQMRDYVFVGDVVRANCAALYRGDNETINIGTGELTSVNELVKLMSRSAEYTRKPDYKPARPGELFKSFLNAKKASRVLGWKPHVKISKGLEETISFFGSIQK